jgi:hypothetical protein
MHELYQLESLELFTSTCDDKSNEQVLKYVRGTWSSGTKATVSIGELMFFREFDGANAADVTRLGKFTGSTQGIAERTYVHDARIPVISEISVVESTVLPGTISAIELVHHDLTPGGVVKPIVEIMGFCDVGANGRCKNPIGSEKINIFEDGSGDVSQTFEYFTDLAVKYANKDASGPLVGVRAYHLDTYNKEDPAFEVNLHSSEGISILPEKDIKTDFISEEDVHKRDPNKGTCELGAMIGIDCNGDHCDNLALYCTKALPKYDEYWVDHLVSDNLDAGKNIKTEALCQNNEAITGLQCESGSDCDNLKIRCAKIDGFDQSKASCSWDKAIVSEERPNKDGIWYKPYGNSTQYLLTGLRCEKGNYCDNKSFRVCKLSGNIKPEGSSWIRLKSAGAKNGQQVKTNEPLLGLSVRFTHPDMTLRSYRETLITGSPAGCGKYGCTPPSRQSIEINEVVPYGGYILGVAGLYESFKRGNSTPAFRSFQDQATGYKSVPIIQSQSQMIGISKDSHNDEARSLLMSLEMFKFTNSFADHQALYDPNSDINATYRLLQGIELCATKSGTSNHIVGMVVKSRNGIVHNIGDKAACNNAGDNAWTSFLLSDYGNQPIVSMQWKPIKIGGRTLIGALQFNLSDGQSFAFDANKSGGGSWVDAFEAFEGYCINGFQGIANTTQTIGKGWAGVRKQFPSISEKVENLGIKGLAALSPIYLQMEFCQGL